MHSPTGFTMRRARQFTFAPLLGIALIGLAACSGGDGGGNPTPTNPTPTLALSASASALDLTQGLTASFTVSVTRGGGFTGDATVTVEGLPTGVSASALTITSASTSGTVTLTASATAVVAGSSLTVRASGAGVTSATATVALNVRAAVTGSASVSFNPSSVVISQGSTVNVTATITRSGGFTGPVTFTVMSNPAGVSIVITPAASTNQTVSVSTNSATVAITASATAVLGTIPIVLAVSGTGITTSTLTLATTVNAPVAANVTLPFCPASGLPVFVAFQDGTTGVWTRSTGNASNAFPVTITQGKGAIAYEYQTAANSYALTVLYGTLAELQERGATICAGQTQTAKSMNGSVVGVTGTDVGSVTMGSSVASITAATGAFTLNNLANGPLDLVASRTSLVVNGSVTSSALARVLIRRGVTVFSGSTISPSVDLQAISAEASAPVFRNATLAGLGTDQAFTITAYSTAGGTVATIFSELPPSNATPRPFPTVPASRQLPGDVHVLAAIAASSFSTSPAFTRFAETVFLTGADKTVTFGPTPNPVTSSVLSAQSPERFRAAVTVQPEYNRLFQAQWTQAGAAPRSVLVLVTQAYAGSVATLNLDIPDLVAAGYTAAFGLQAGAATTLSVNAASWDMPGGVFTTPFVDGATFRAGVRNLIAQ